MVRAILCLLLLCAVSCGQYNASQSLLGLLLLSSQVAVTSSSSPSTSVNVKRLFTTTLNMNGGIGSIAAADAVCAADAAKPTTATYKAMIVDSTGARVACSTANCAGGIAENIGWVFKASTSYVRADGVTPVFTSNTAAIFDFGSGSFTNSIDGSGNRFWTGLATDWRTSATHCVDWTDSTAGANGERGFPNQVTSAAISSGIVTCNGTRALLCVEQ